MKKELFVISFSIVLISFAVKAEIRTGTSCNGKCHWTYDTVTHDAKILKNPEVGENEEVIIPENIHYTMIMHHFL